MAVQIATTSATAPVMASVVLPLWEVISSTWRGVTRPPSEMRFGM